MLTQKDQDACRVEEGEGGKIPFAEPAHAFFQIASRLEPGVRHVLHGYIGKRVPDQRGELVWELEKRVIAALYCQK